MNKTRKSKIIRKKNIYRIGYSKFSGWKSNGPSFIIFFFTLRYLTFSYIWGHSSTWFPSMLMVVLSNNDLPLEYIQFFFFKWIRLHLSQQLLCDGLKYCFCLLKAIFHGDFLSDFKHLKCWRGEWLHKSIVKRWSMQVLKWTTKWTKIKIKSMLQRFRLFIRS